MKAITSRFATAVALTALPLLLMACSTEAPAPTNTVKLRVLDLTPAGEIVIWAEQLKNPTDYPLEVRLEPFVVPNDITRWPLQYRAELELEPGTWMLDVIPVNTALGGAGDRLEVELEASGRYTVVIWEHLGENHSRIIKDRWGPVAAEEIGFRVINTYPWADSVDIFRLDTGEAIAVAVDYGRVSDTLKLPHDAHRFGVDVDRDGIHDAIFSTRALPLGRVKDVILSANDFGDLLVRIPNGIDWGIDIDPIRNRGVDSICHDNQDPACWVDPQLVPTRP